MVQNLRVAVVSAIRVLVAWSEPSEATEVMEGYVVELRQYTQGNMGTVEVVSLHNFALAVRETSIVIDSLSE